MNSERTLLLVDDDEDDRIFFQEALTKIDTSIKCWVASDGLEALSKLTNCIKLPDFVFLDLNMPRMGGKECLRAIKQVKRFTPIPVFIYSTSRVSEEVEELLQLGAARYIKKPVRFDQICAAISDAIAYADTFPISNDKYVLQV